MSVSVVHVPVVVGQLTPPSVERCQSLVPVELDTDSCILFEPSHAGLAVIKVTVPATGEAATVNVDAEDATVPQLLVVVTRTITSYVPAPKPVKV